MQEKGFWDDIKRAEDVTKESKSIKDKIDRYESLVTRLDDVNGIPQRWQEAREKKKALYRKNIIKKKATGWAGSSLWRGGAPAWYPISRLYTALRKRHLYPSVPDVFPLLQFHPL